MKKIVIIIPLVLAVICTIGLLYSLGGTPSGFEGKDPSLYSDNLEMRRAAWRKLAIEEPEKHKDAILPILVAGLQDKDTEVKRHSAAIAARIAYAAPVDATSSQLKIFTEQVGVRSALIGAIEDADSEVRVSALLAIAWGVNPSGDIEVKVSRVFEQEVNCKVRETILDVIGIHNYTSGGAAKVLSSGLDDPNPSVRQRDARIISKLRPPPASILPKLVDKLTTEEASVVLAIIPAVAAYQSQAKPYVLQLEQAIDQIDAGLREMYTKSYVKPLLAQE